MDVKQLTPGERNIAYFSMEIGISNAIPSYSGGLGILAGDTLKAAADLGVPIVGVTLLSEKGYFKQHLDERGNQTESPVGWDVRAQLGDPLPVKVNVTIAGREVFVQAWQYDIVGSTGFRVPVLFLDTNISANAPQDQTLTSYLYGGDQRYRLSQEVVLGIGGVRILKALGYEITRYHMNEGHASLLALELFRNHALQSGCPLDDFATCMANDIREIRQLCVFTTHTPVAAGHDQFPYQLAQEILGDFVPLDLLQKLGGQDGLNMTMLALNLSHYVNSVAKQHMLVSKHLFPGYRISFITNGVHSATWTCPSFSTLYDRHIPNWRQDSFDLRYALRIPEIEIWNAHQEAKRALIQRISRTQGITLDENVFTIGFARRATAYKRATLLFTTIERLVAIGKHHKIQIVFAGKAHPKDTEGKELIRQIYEKIAQLGVTIKAVYLEEYDIALAQLLTSGVDVWLNTPARPKEASGTSGMKAAHNGVPQFSVLDGWWVEGHISGVTGWSIGPMPSNPEDEVNDDAADAQELYDKLEHIILPMYYEHPQKWQRVMRSAIAFNASFFNTHRMVQQYVLNAYFS